VQFSPEQEILAIARNIESLWSGKVICQWYCARKPDEIVRLARHAKIMRLFIKLLKVMAGDSVTSALNPRCVNRLAGARVCANLCRVAICISQPTAIVANLTSLLTIAF